jgi:phospholipid/cholesterol/gamma-HCH transport system substrate-binding protein
MKNTLETRLGIFFALALIVSVIILEMIGAADFLKRGYQVSAYFKTAQELKKSDQVKLAGVEIGTVEDIQIVTNRARVTMKIQQKYEIRTDSRAVIKFAGLMGQNFVSVEGGSDGAPRLLDGGTLQTGEQPDLGAVMQKLQDVATGVEGLTKSFSPDNFSTLLAPIMDFVRQNSPPLTAMIGNLKTVSDQIVQGRGSVGRLINDDSFYTAAYSTVTNLQSTSADLKGMMKDVEGMIGKANSVIDQVKAGQGTVGKLVTDETLYRETAAAMEQLNQILGKINKGQGSVGQLVNDEAFLKNAKMSLQKLDKATDSLEDQGPLSVLGLVIGTLF